MSSGFLLTKLNWLQGGGGGILWEEKYSLQGVKSQDFLDFKIIAKLMKDKAHLTKEGIEEIKRIKSGMNSKRK